MITGPTLSLAPAEESRPVISLDGLVELIEGVTSAVTFTRCRYGVVERGRDVVQEGRQVDVVTAPRRPR